MDFDRLKIVERRIVKGQSVELNPPFDNSAPEAVDWYQVFKHDAKHFAHGPSGVSFARKHQLGKYNLVSIYKLSYSMERNNFSMEHSDFEMVTFMC